MRSTETSYRYERGWTRRPSLRPGRQAERSRSTPRARKPSPWATRRRRLWRHWPNRAVSAAHGLTERELDVLRLVVAGRTDRGIAEALFIGHRTAQTHVANILGKLGVTSRTAAATAAIAAR